jgi:hypothetical protein
MVLLACTALLAGAAGWPAWTARADEDAATLEDRVKAAYLYKFAGFVEWPAKSFTRPDTPVTIAVLGADPVVMELNQAVAGRTVNDRPLAVRRLRTGDSLAGVHILFVGKSESARLTQLAQATQPRSILTVTESDGALEQGSVINFVRADRRVRFEISVESAEKSGLRLSSRLLAVAQDVRTGAR